jgi:hypothetical protein
MISSRTKTLLLRIFAFLVVMLFGAVVFLVTEGRDTTTEPKEVDFQKMYNISKQDYDLLLESVRNDASISSVAKLPWTFGNSVYFVIVLMTTIGKSMFSQFAFPNVSQPSSIMLESAFLIP